MNKILVIGMFSIAAIGCAQTQNNPVNVSNHEAHIHWDYSNKDEWGSLSKKFATCNSGKIQSPIDVRTSIYFKKLPKLQMKYKETPLVVVNNGHSIQVNTTADYGFKVGKEGYKLLQFHFHTPSENKINGKSYPLEMHLVHKSKEGYLAVIAVMFEEGKTNAEIEKIWKAAPKKEGEATVDGTIDIRKLLPKNLNHYARFTGSLTTPPCTEGISWFVLEEPITLSKEQIKYFKTIYENNARNIQKTNNRLIIGS